MGASNEANFNKQKQAAIEVVKPEKNSDVIYEVIRYGKGAAVEKSLAVKMDKKALVTFLYSLPWQEPGEALLAGVRQAQLSFERHGRPKARKILVVFSDNRLNESSPVVEKTGGDLRRTEIKIIGILVGKNGEEDKITTLAGKKPLKIDETNEPKETGKQIAEEILKGWRLMKDKNFSSLEVFL